MTFGPLTPVSQAKAIAAGVGLALLLAALALAAWKINDWRVRANAAETQVVALEGTAEATKGTVDKLDDALVDRGDVEKVATTTRAAARRATEEYLHADPAAAADRAVPIPDELRRIARQRREDRERRTAVRPEGAGAGSSRAD